MRAAPADLDFLGVNTSVPSAQGACTQRGHFILSLREDRA